MEKIYNLTETKPEIKTEELSSDFLDLKIMPDEKIQYEPKTIERDDDTASVACFVMLEDFKDFKAKDGSYNLDILGEKMFEYVVRACPETPKLIHFDHEQTNVIKAIKPHLDDSEYTLVLFADTPLITRKNVLNILDFVKAKGLNVCPLSRGYVFKTEYIKRVDDIYSPSVYYFDEQDFMMAISYSQLHLITEILKNRIIEYHSKNGVYFKDPNTLYIEAGVKIKEGTSVGSFVSLSQDTYIGKNVIIENNSCLKNAKVMDDCIISGAYLDGAYVYKNCKISRGAKLFSQTAIKENSTVGEDTIISNAIIDKDSNIGKNNIINYVMAKDQISIGNNCHISGTASHPVQMEKGACVCDLVTILDGVKILENQKIASGEIVKSPKVGDMYD